MTNIYPSNFETKIGFDRVRELLKNKCLSSMGKEAVEGEKFSSRLDVVGKRLDETVEFMEIIREEMNFPTGYYLDMRESLQKIRVEGTFLDVHELFDLKRSLETVRAIVAFFKNREEEEFPRLKDVTKSISLYPFIYDQIERIISKHGKIKDNASSTLSGIRKEIFSKQSGVSKTMQGILRKAVKDGLVDKDVSVSIRDGRAVIPVLSANKRKLKGIIHDESATGHTSYVEPAEIVEINNRIRELESAERREIVKILIKFTDDIRPYIEDLRSSYEVLAELDFIRAKALWSIETNSVKPQLSGKPEMDWVKARHPLLEKTLAKESREVVPLTINLSDHGRILLISGPNAGGKSVCLKTTGLLQYTLQCGIPVPLAEESRAGLFGKMFIDIGDDQSLENDLSTYSSHLMNMKFFVRNCNQDTLILIDEFGTGTEPMLGGAIAESILNRMNQMKTYGVITTHYTNLKHFASSAEGIENGAMLYDSHRMEPLFQLQIGKPGSSFAFEIARKIGLTEEILQEATDKIGKEHIHFDKHLRDIVRDKRYWETKRQKIRKVEKRLDELAAQYESGLEDTEKLRKEILEKARNEADEILSGSNKIVERTIREIKESNAEKERTRNAREKLDEYKKDISKKVVEDDAKIQRKIDKIRQREDRRKEKSPSPYTVKNSPVKDKVVEEQGFSIGDKVRLKGQENIGEVIEVKGKSITVAFGMLRSVVKGEKLERVSNNEAKRSVQNKTKSYVNDRISEMKLTFKPDIDVRGMRAEEVLHKMQEFIDEAIMVEAKELRILHGKGSGVLRELIRNLLQVEPLVKNYRDEHVQQGGTGITIVELE